MRSPPRLAAGHPSLGPARSAGRAAASAVLSPRSPPPHRPADRSTPRPTRRPPPAPWSLRVVSDADDHGHGPDLARSPPRISVMHRALVLLLAPLALAACAAEPPRLEPARVVEPPALPPRGHLAERADVLTGPRVMSERTHGRALFMYGNTSARARVLVAGCANGRRCAGTDVVRTAMVGCPPPDAELWFLPTLRPSGADLDAAPTHPGAAVWRQAVADLRPRFAIVFRTGPAATVRAIGPDLAAARRFARIAGVPFERAAPRGLAAWTTIGPPAHDLDHRRAPWRAGLRAPGRAAGVRARPPRGHALRGRRPPGASRDDPAPSRPANVTNLCRMCAKTRTNVRSVRPCP